MEFLKEARRNKKEVWYQEHFYNPILAWQQHSKVFKPIINEGKVGKKLDIYGFLLCQQQLEQLQKELNFLEDDIKRVEVNYQTHLHQRSPTFLLQGPV